MPTKVSASPIYSAYPVKKPRGRKSRFLRPGYFDQFDLAAATERTEANLKYARRVALHVAGKFNAFHYLDDITQACLICLWKLSVEWKPRNAQSNFARFAIHRMRWAGIKFLIDELHLARDWAHTSIDGLSGELTKDEWEAQLKRQRALDRSLSFARHSDLRAYEAVQDRVEALPWETLTSFETKIIRLYYFDGLIYKQIAKRLRVPYGHVFKHHNIALEKLRANEGRPHGGTKCLTNHPTRVEMLVAPT